MVTKNSNTAPKPAPAPKADAATGTPEAAADTGETNVTTIKANTSPGRSQTNRPSLMASVRSDDTQRIADKIRVVGTVKQRLAEAADLFKAGDDKRDEATAIADKAGVTLYQARTTNVINAEEISAMLGDVFGFKPKSDGTPGKTPMGQGEAIRKRVVRAVQADEYANGGEETAFFKGLNEDEVRSILLAVQAGEMSIYTAYDKFAELKRDNTTRTNAAFDPKKIAAIYDTLAEGGGQAAAEIFRKSPALVAVYAALVEALEIVDEIAATMNADDAKAAKEAKAA